MTFGAFENSDILISLKTWVINAFGIMGLSISAFANEIAFHDSGWFKAMLAVSGFVLGLLAIYSTYLDVKIKRRNLGDT